MGMGMYLPSCLKEGAFTYSVLHTIGWNSFLCCSLSSYDRYYLLAQVKRLSIQSVFSFSQHNNELFIGTGNSIVIFDVGNNIHSIGFVYSLILDEETQVCSLQGHQQEIHAISFNNFGTQCLTTSYEAIILWKRTKTSIFKKLYVWDTHTPGFENSAFLKVCILLGV